MLVRLSVKSWELIAKRISLGTSCYRQDPETLQGESLSTARFMFAAHRADSRFRSFKLLQVSFHRNSLPSIQRGRIVWKMRNRGGGKQVHLFVIIAPSFAFADQVAPILDSLSRAGWNVKLTAVVPSPQILLEYDRDWLPARIIQDMTSSVVFRSYTGLWVCSPSFEQAKRLQISIQLIGRVRLKTLKLKMSWLTRTCDIFESLIVGLAGTSEMLNSGPHIPSGSRVLLDITELSKSYFEELLTVLPFSRCIGVMHGLGFPKEMHANADQYRKGPVARVIRSARVVSQSKGESIFYDRVVGVPREGIHELGVLRHEREWLEQFSSPKANKPLNATGQLVLVSRPIGSWLPRQRKLRNLRAIRRIANEFGFRIVVKRHPKETQDGLLLRGLGNPRSKFGWEISRQHILELANSAQLAITFDSGTCLDFLACGIPTIQLLDLSGISGIEDAELDEKTGQPVSPYVKSGVVLHAFDEQSLRNQVNNLLSNGGDIIHSMQTQFSSEFFQASDSNSVLSRILGLGEH